MAGKISEMTPASALTGAEMVEVTQSGATRRTTTGDIAALVPQKFRGVYVSLAALVAAIPTANAGDFADVDSGSGSNAARYIWDASDAAWLEQSGSGAGMSNPMTTAGDLIVGASGGTAVRLGLGSALQVLRVNTAGTEVEWAAASTGGASFAPVITESTTARALALTDAGAYLRHTNASASTLTVPPQSSVSWAADTEVHVRRASSGTLTLTPGSGVTLNAPSGGTLVMGNNMSVTLKRVAADVWDVIGQTVAA